MENLNKRLVDVLPKYPQWEHIIYAGDFTCPHCDKSGFVDLYGKVVESPNIVGWCETSIGYMGIFECTHCFNKYRFHCTIGTYNADIDEFDIYLYYKARECKNWSEIKVKLF